MVEEWSDAEKRPLVWPLRESEIVQSETPDDATMSGVFVWPEDPDEQTLVIFRLSQHEYTALASTIDVGRDIAFGVDSVKLWWLWIRNMIEVPQICEMIIECINSDEGVRAALSNFIVDQAINNNELQDALRQAVGRTGSQSITDPLVGGDCDDSVVAGQMLQLVDRLDVNNTDFFEILEVGTNDEERVSAVLAAIPGLSESPVDEIIDIAQSILEDIQENYAAGVTAEWKEERARDLWCIAKEHPDCELTYTQVFEYFRDRAGASLTISSLIYEVVNFVINGDFDTDELAASGMYAIQLGFVLTGQSFNGLKIPTIGAIMRDASPSSAWEEWDPCGPPPDCFEFAIDEQGWVPTGGAGAAQWESGKGWHQENTGGGMSITLLDVTEEVTNLQCHFYRGFAGAGANPDYDKVTITVAGGTGSTAPTTTYPGSPTFLATGQVFDIVPATEGQFWKGNITVYIAAGGNSWPDVSPNPSAPQWLERICFNPDD